MLASLIRANHQGWKKPASAAHMFDGVFTPASPSASEPNADLLEYRCNGRERYYLLTFTATLR